MISQVHIHGNYLCSSPDSTEHNQLSENLEFEAHKQMCSSKSTAFVLAFPTWKEHEPGKQSPTKQAKHLQSGEIHCN